MNLFPVFWYESNPVWGNVESIEDLYRMFELQLAEPNSIESVDDFLDKSKQVDGLALNFGTRREHTSTRTLRDYLIEHDHLLNFQVRVLKDLVFAENLNGNIVLSMVDGLHVVNLNQFIEQETDGMLYDLNRTESTVMAFLGDPKWINDFAACKVIRSLKHKIKKLELELAELKQVV